MAITLGYVTIDCADPRTLGRFWSQALGWSRTGIAVVHIFFGECGNGIPRPGVYLIDPRNGSRKLLYGTRTGYAMMWHS